ncbi:hypothetical protein [Streptomyces sp. B1I3]|uniref:hypothetical protein n=1 Tax=Streptomyces sp. B1I3 TaxID=3042264 RepID=UPI00277FFF84|nr:hypothetical protein [Streptomyces sp. B1I3]MDQ0792030.1 chromosome segregation ATPase [Streptomyces sp. B1I3]
MTERISLDDLTSDQLDALYERLDFLDRTTLPNLHHRIEHDAETIRRWRGRAESAELRASQAEAEVTRLTAGQCIDSRRMCEQHHTRPVQAETDVVMAVRDAEMIQLRYERDQLREALATVTGQCRGLEGQLVAARSTVDRVQAATSALADQADGFLAHHNPACECEWGQALGQAAGRIQSALDQPQQPPTP